MPRISQLTTEQPGSTSDIPLNVGSTTRRANVGQVVGAIYTSQGQMAYAASSGNSTFLNPPSSGAVLTYSSGSSIPAWSIPTSGAFLAASSLGVPTWIAKGTSGQALQSTGGRPTWTTPSQWLLSRVSSVTLTTGVSVAINWLDEEIDTDDFHSTAVNSSHVTITVTGNYLMGFNFILETSVADGVVASIREGTTELSQARFGGGGEIPGMTVSVLRRFATTGATIIPAVFVRTANSIWGSSGAAQLTKFWGFRTGP